MRRLNNLFMVFICILTPGISAADGYSGNSAYISTADNQWALWLPMDSNLSIATAFEVLAKDWSVTRIFWRGAQSELWKDTYAIREQNRLYRYFWDWSFGLIDSGNNSSAFAEATKNGIDLWAHYGLFEVGSPADSSCGSYPYPDQDAGIIAHPEWMPVNKYRTRRQPGPIDFCYPEARTYLVNKLTDFLVANDYQGMSFYTYVENFGIRYQDEFGYNQPVVDEFQNRYGVDILTEDFNKDAWARLRGEYVTQFLQELHGSLTAHGKKICIWINPNDSHKPMTWMNGPISTAGNIYMDWEQWVQLGIVDELMVYWPGNSTLLNQMNTYCQGTNTVVSTMVSYGSLPPGVIRVLQPGWPCESGYDYNDMIGYGGTPYAEPLSSLGGTDAYAKRRVLYLIEQGMLSATVADVSPLINDGDLYVRRLAVRALATIGDAGGVSHIEAALLDGENSVRCQAALSLAVLRGTDSVQKMLEAIENNSTFQYDLVAFPQSLLDLKNANKIQTQDITALGNALSNSNVNVRRAALRGLYQMNCSGYLGLKPEIISVLQHDPDTFCREYAVYCLGYFFTDSDAKTALQQAFVNDSDAVVQVRAVGFQTLNDVLELFERYGDMSTRSDYEWGWREVGSAIVAKGGVNELEQMIKQKSDMCLADLAWRVLYMPQDRANYVFTSEEQDSQAHLYQPTFVNQLPVEIFKDDFQNVIAVEGYPFIESDSDPTAQIGSWTQIQESLVSDIQVVKDLDPFAFEKGQYAAVKSSPVTVLRGNFSNIIDDYLEYSIIKIEFAFYLKENSNLDFTVRNSTDNGADKIVLSCRFNPENMLEYQNSSGWVSTNVSLHADRWYKVIILADLPSQTYELYIADKVVSSLPFTSTQSKAQQIVWSSSATTSHYYLDAIEAKLSPVCLSWPDADLSGDCRVDINDFAFFASQWLNSY